MNWYNENYFNSVVNPSVNQGKLKENSWEWLHMAQRSKGTKKISPNSHKLEEEDQKTTVSVKWGIKTKF